MVNIQERISKLCPAVTFEENEVLTAIVPDKDWHGLAKSLKEESDLDFDYLVAIVGVDWKESLGCVYYFTSTKYNTHVSIKVATTDLENPMIHSVSDLWKSAEIGRAHV